MEYWMIGVIGVAFLFGLLAIGVNVAVALLAVGFIGSVVIVGFDAGATQAITTIYYKVTVPTLIILPLFVFMGLLAAAGGISHDIFRTLSMWTGRFRAGLGIATVVSNAAFGAVCGTGLVSAAVFGRVAAPQMRKQGYDKRLAYGITASAGSIGMLIPPSLYIVIWAMLTEQSAGRLLIAGIGPGILLTVLFSLGIVAISRVRPSWVGSPPPPVSWRQRFAALRLFWSVIIVASILIGGIFFGVFGVTEASAISVIVIIILTILVTGKERWRHIGQSLNEAAVVTGMIFLILCGAMVLSRFFALTGITGGALGFIIDLNLTPVTFMGVMVVVYIIMGCFFTGLAMIAFTLPVIYPAVLAMGIDQIWFAMVMILAIELGGITPPVGNICYVTKAVAEPDVRLEDIFAGIIPFFFIWLIALAVLLAVPWISTVLPSLMW